MKMEMTDGDSYRRNINIPNLLKMLINVLMTGATYDYNQNQFNLYDTNKSLSRIQKCIKYEVPANSSNDINENLVYIKNYINSINSKLSETVSSVDVPLLKEIALAISSLASANDNLAIKDLKQAVEEVSTNINNKDNVLVVDGTPKPLNLDLKPMKVEIKNGKN